MNRLRHPLIHPFSGWDMNQLVDARAQSRSTHPFLIWEPFDGRTEIWSYAKFASDTKRIAAGLAKRGIRVGDKVLLHFENCPETVLAWYACARLGAIALTTNARSAAPELAYFADNSGAVAAITQPKFAELVASACKSLRWIAVTDHDAGEAPKTAGVSCCDSFAALYAHESDCPVLAVDPMRDISIQYTSGTTSRPKGVVWTHANALWGFRVNALHTDLRADDIHLVQLPLFHTNAQAYSLGASLYAGASCVIMPKFSASRFWDVSMKHRCTWASMITFFERALSASGERVPAHHYRLWGNAISEPPSDAKFGVRTMGWWGMTETMTHGIVADAHHANRSMMIGKAAPEYGVTILKDDGTLSEPGEVGHLRILGIPGLSLFKEYLNNAGATSDAYDEDGWFITGDRVILHADGFIQFSDRDKDMLKVGGENVAASEIERVIYTVTGVQEVAVIGKQDPIRQEVPVAFVVCKSGTSRLPVEMESDILSTCEQQLADFKVPRAVHFLEDFPRSVLQKIAKAKLREQLEAGLFS
jgi:crotonobetaine/carnitine-CoA ligase